MVAISDCGTDLDHKTDKRISTQFSDLNYYNLTFSSSCYSPEDGGISGSFLCVSRSYVSLAVDAGESVM